MVVGARERAGGFHGRLVRGTEERGERFGEAEANAVHGGRLARVVRGVVVRITDGSGSEFAK